MTEVRILVDPHMEDRIQNLEKEIEIIKARNRKVEGDKAWETSLFRTLIICAILYVIELRYFITSGNYFLNALITTTGFFLSVQSFSFIKRWWIKNHTQK